MNHANIAPVSASIFTTRVSRFRLLQYGSCLCRIRLPAAKPQPELPAEPAVLGVLRVYRFGGGLRIAQQQADDRFENILFCQFRVA